MHGARPTPNVRRERYAGFVFGNDKGLAAVVSDEGGENWFVGRLVDQRIRT